MLNSVLKSEKLRFRKKKLCCNVLKEKHVLPKEFVISFFDGHQNRFAL